MLKIKILKFCKYILTAALLLSGFALYADIERERTNSVGDKDSSWQGGLITPSDADADDACSIVAGLPFSCTLPVSGGGSVTCTPVSLPPGITLSSGCVLAGTAANFFSVDVEFDDGVSDTVTQTINLTTGPNQNPTATDPTGCDAPKSGFAWTCDLAGSVTDPEGQSMTYSLGSSAPSWVSLSGAVISGLPPTSGSIGVPYEISDGVNNISYTYNITIIAGTAEAIQGNDPVSASLLGDAGVDADLIASLELTGCGSDGTSTCLDIFNANKGSTSCSLEGGSSASADQIEDFAVCVIVEDATATAASVPDTFETASASSGCDASVSQNVVIPSFCGYPAWRCSIDNAHTDWNILTHTGGQWDQHGPAPYGVEIPGNTSASGTVTLKVTAKMGGSAFSDYTIKEVDVPVDVNQAVADAVNGKKTYQYSNGVTNWMTGWNKCNSVGGKVAFYSDATNTDGNAIFFPDNITDRRLPTRANGDNGPTGGSGNWQCYNWDVDGEKDYGPHMTYNGNDSYSCNCVNCGPISGWWINGSTRPNTTYNVTCVDLPSCN